MNSRAVYAVLWKETAMGHRTRLRFMRHPRTSPARVALYRQAVAMACETGLDAMAIFDYWDEPFMFRPSLMVRPSAAWKTTKRGER